MAKDSSAHHPVVTRSAATKPERDVEKVYSVKESVAKLRRLADALEQEKPFRIQVAGERIRVPRHAEFSIEHERGEDSEEVELQLTWSLRVDEAADGESLAEV